MGSHHTRTSSPGTHGAGTARSRGDACRRGSAPRVTISSRHMARLPAADATLATVERIASAPTAPYHELRALRAIASELETLGIPTETDTYGQIHARVRAGSSAHALAL